MIPAPDSIDKDIILGWCILIAFAAWLATLTWYMIRAKWWKSAYGINTWLVSFTITVALLRLSILVLAPGYLSHELSDNVGIFTYVLLAIGGVQRLYLLELAQREGEREKAARAPTLHHKAMEH